MKKYKDVLKIPVNRIIALLFMDLLSILVASFGAVYLRFELKFSLIPQEYLEMYAQMVLKDKIIKYLFRHN